MLTGNALCSVLQAFPGASPEYLVGICLLCSSLFETLLSTEPLTVHPFVVALPAASRTCNHEKFKDVNSKKFETMVKINNRFLGQRLSFSSCK